MSCGKSGLVHIIRYIIEPTILAQGILFILSNYSLILDDCLLDSLKWLARGKVTGLQSNKENFSSIFFTWEH